MASQNYIGAVARAKWRKQAHAADPRCAYCERVTHEGGPRDELLATVDHRQPLARGGLDRPDNFALSCALCNHAKGSGKLTGERRRALILRLAKNRMKR